MSTSDNLFEYCHSNPSDRNGWLVYSDALKEEGRDQRASAVNYGGPICEY